MDRDYCTFPTRKAARQETETMAGWTTAVLKLFLPDDPNADKHGYAYVIQCNSDGYLRRDGYVRS